MWIRSRLAAAAIIIVAIGHGVFANTSGEGRHEKLYRVTGQLFQLIDGYPIEINDANLYCLGCHDGTLGPVRQLSTPNDGCSPSGVHQVGAQYPSGDPGFNSHDGLPDSMYFEGDRMTCLTCHSAEDADHRVNVPTRRSELCLTCHSK